MSQISNRKSPFASSTGTYSESTPLNEVDSMLILPEERVDTFRDFSEPTEHKPLLPSLQNNIDTDNKHMLVCSYGMHLIQNRKPTMRIINYFKQYHTTSALKDIIFNTPKPVPRHSESTFSPPSTNKIRDHLRIWQEYTKSLASRDTPLKKVTSQLGASSINFSQSGEDLGFHTIDEVDETWERRLNAGLMSTNDDLENSNTHIYLQKGDLVELLNNGKPILAVVTRSFDEQLQFYTMYGAWCHLSSQCNITFFIPKMILSNELCTIVPYLPESEIPEDGLARLQALNNQIPREAGAKLIQKMLFFDHSANEITRAYARRLNQAHEIISHPTDRLHLTLQEIAIKVLQKDDPTELTEPMLWAVHRVLMHNEHFTANWTRHRLYPLWDVRSKVSANSMEKVREWLRDYNEGIVNGAAEIPEPSYSTANETHQTNPFPHFIEKARLVIQECRKSRMVTQSPAIGPSSVKIKVTNPDRTIWRRFRSTSFTRDETLIIDYLYAWGTSDTLGRSPSFLSIGSMILRATGMYENFTLDEATGHLFIQELGVLPPWFNRASVHHGFSLPTHQDDSSSGQLYLQASRSVVEFQMEDAMRGLRRDWGDLEVFCIDEAHALEIDDGVSLEEVEGSSSMFWVHVHVANPSAFLGPHSAMGRYAKHLTQSIYFPERTYSLISPEITHKHLSLAQNRPCITFSAKLTTAGELIDTQISHGIVQKVTYMTPKFIQSELDPGNKPELEEIDLTVGGEWPLKPMKPKAPPMTASQKSTLRKLSELGAARRQRNIEEGGVFYPSHHMDPDIMVYQGPTNDNTKPARRVHTWGYRYEGDPIIRFNHTYSLEANQNHATLPVQMVADLMLLAGEIGALWCSKRNIPIPYRGTTPRPDPPEDPESFKRRVLDPVIETNGNALIDDVRTYIRLLGKTSLAVQPITHKIIGLGAYTRVTSPLRRYSDLMAHWQIEAAIRHELQTGTSLIGSTDDSYLPFSRSEAERIIEHLAEREAAASKISTWSQRLWTAQFLFRAFYFKEAPLPESFRVKCIGNMFFRGEAVVLARLHEFKVVLRILEDPITKREGGMRIGDWWEIKITHINCYTAGITAEAIRLVKRTDVPQP